jgi:SNF family Na+-dependent transporter
VVGNKEALFFLLAYSANNMLSVIELAQLLTGALDEKFNVSRKKNIFFFTQQLRVGKMSQ